MSRLTIIFPVETIVRELDARLVLASVFGQKHHRIVLAHSSHANRLAACLPGGGLYVGKHIMATGGAESTHYNRAKANNFAVLQLAEEGAVFMGKPKDWASDLDWQLTASDLVEEDYVATWGDWQRNYYCKMGAKNQKNIRTTGHPRFEIYKTRLKDIYEEDAAQIKSRFGDFILVNSNFGFALNALGVQDTFSRWQGYYPENASDRLRFVQRWSKQNSVYAAFIELIHALSVNFPKLNIVIRPHPSDDFHQIKAVVSGVRNIHVIREGHVAPWILASRVMLNDGSTTAIEAYLLGKQIVNFSPVENKHEAFLPNLLGIRARTQQEAIEAIMDAMGMHPQKNELPELAHKLFANFRCDSMALFLDMLREVESRSLRTSAAITPSILFDQAKFMAIEKTKQFARQTLFHQRYKAAMATQVLFPGFSPKYIQDRLLSIAKITGRFVEMKYYSPWLVELNPISSKPAKWPL